MPHNLHKLFLFILFCTFASTTSILAQSGGNLAECKKWFNKSIKELPKGKNTFATKYFTTPFLRGLSSDAHFTYDKITEQKELQFCVSTFFTDCLKDFKKSSKVSFKEVIANEESLYNLNIRIEDQFDADGNLVPQNNEIPYKDLINHGDQVFIISSDCGPVYKIYDLPLTVTLYVMYNPTLKQYKFCAGVIGF